MFGALARLIAAPVRIVNIPLDLAEKVMDDGLPSERTVSAPLRIIAETIESVGDEIDDGFDE
jgi:hypothetical protein